MVASWVGSLLDTGSFWVGVLVGAALTGLVVRIALRASMRAFHAAVEQQIADAKTRQAEQASSAGGFVDRVGRSGARNGVMTVEPTITGAPEYEHWPPVPFSISPANHATRDGSMPS